MRIGIVGAGQLARMMILAGYPMGLEFRVQDRAADLSAALISDCRVGPIDEPDSLAEFARSVDLVTFDIENLSEGAALAAAAEAPFRPPVPALVLAQDRLSEKTLFERLKIPTARYRRVDSLQDLEAALEDIGLPAMLKTRRLGYDGRGQIRLENPAEASAAWQSLGQVPMICEELIAFDAEVSLVAARNPAGEVSFYDLAENHHWEGILDYSIAPCGFAHLQGQAERYLGRLLDTLAYCGVLTVEFFVRGDTLIANEMAPRVHNSGHWTIEGTDTSQFENHLRAILDWPLGSSRARGFSAMVNFLGTLPDIHSVLRIPGAHFHDYGKTPRTRRKVGHATVVADSEAERDEALHAVRRLLGTRAADNRRQ